MDAHLLIKIIHMSAVALLIIAFISRASTLFIGVQEQQPNPKARKLLVALQHLSLSLIILTGVVLLVMKGFQVQSWFYAKIILFLVLWSSLIKAYKKDPTMLLVQRRAGLIIAAIALMGVLALVMIKPVFA